jgi:S1-C subfamily serine protease
MVRRVFPEGPASEAGVQPVERRVENIFLQGYVLDFSRGDLIVKVNGQRVASKDEVEELISRSDTNEPVSVTLRLGGPNGRERTVSMKPVLK